MEDVFEGAVGIDLGTTYSLVFRLSISPSANPPKRCVGVWQNDRVEIIANDRQLRSFFTPQKHESFFIQRGTAQPHPMSHFPLKNV